MSAAQYELISNIPEGRCHVVRFVGGTNAVTKVSGTGEGITVTYVDAGRVTFTWSQLYDPGTFIGGHVTFQATTPGDVKAYVGVLEPYASRSVRLCMYESGTLTDLAALEWATATLWFKETNV